MLSEPQPISEIEGVDAARFEAEIKPAARPVVMRGLVADWPAVDRARAGPEALMAYLGGYDAGREARVFVGGAGMGGRFSFTEDVGGFNHQQTTMSLRELFARLKAGGTEHIYAGGVPIPQALPGLETDNPAPLLAADKERLTSLWIGNRSTTAAHWDLAQNLACVVAGRRRFTLMPPEAVGDLYVGPIDRTLAGQPTSLVDFAAPDLERFPRFPNALAMAQTADLGPGDVLYIPSLWWHHVDTSGPFGAMINLWWRDGPEYLTTPMLSLFHALLTMADLPEPERQAWRTLFDHYVFRTGGDPAAHLPKAARGVLDPSSPEARQRIRAILSRSLQR